MKILIIGPFPEPIHGMSLANLNLYKSFISDNIKVDKHDTVFDRKLKSKSKQGQFDFKYLLSSISDLFILFRSVLLGSYDVIYLTPGQSLLGFLRFLPVLIIAKVLKVKLIQHIHGSKLHDNYEKSNIILKLLAKLDIRITDRFIVLSDTIARKFSALIPNTKMEVCLNGIQLPCIEINNKQAEKSELDILFLSNLMKDKGVLELFEAIENQSMPKYKFHFAGSIESEINAVCKNFFDRNGDTCRYYGVISGSDKDKLLQKADVFILPSYDEGVPLSILEAYAYSCAVIVTKVGGIPDIFVNGVNGLYVDVGSCDSICNALTSIDDDLKRYQVENRKLAVEKFSLEDFYSRVKEVIIKVF